MPRIGTQKTSTVLTLGLLPGATALDSETLKVNDMNSARLYATYTHADPAGQLMIQIYVSPTASGPFIFVEPAKYTTVGTTQDVVIDIDLTHVARFKVTCTEVGNTAAPGTVTGTVIVSSAKSLTVQGKTPITALGDLIVGNASGDPVKLGIGSTGQVLKVAGGTATWAAESGGGGTSPVTTLGDIVVADALGAEARLPIGTDGQVLTVTAGTAAWATPDAAGMTNPMTTAGDIIIGGVSGAAGRLGIGSESQILTTVAGVPVWATPATQLPTATKLGQAPVSTGAGTTYTAQDVTTRLDLATMLGNVNHKYITLFDPVEDVLELGSLSADNPLATMIYNTGSLTLTAGVNSDITALGMPLGKQLLFSFTSADREFSGPYVVTDVGADDPSGHPAVFTRRSDFNASGDIVVGATFPCSQSVAGSVLPSLYRLTTTGSYTLDTTPLVFERLLFATPDNTVSPTTTANAALYDVILADATAGAMNIILPQATNGAGFVRVKKIDASGNAVTVLRDSTDTIDGATSVVLSAQYANTVLYSNGVDNWFVF